MVSFDSHRIAKTCQHAFPLGAHWNHGFQSIGPILQRGFSIKYVLPYSGSL